jgi:GT2 family glycosyltransferase
VISVIVCSIDDAKYRSVCDHYARALTSHEHEVIGIPDARSLAEGYNRGIDRARGDVLIFSHDDVEPLITDLGDRLRHHLNDHDMLGLAGTTKLVGSKWVEAGPPHSVGQIAQLNRAADAFDVVIWSAPRPCVGEMHALDGVFLCVRREVARAVGFDEVTFDGFHLYDLDFTYRAHLAGHNLAVCCDLPFIHSSSGAFVSTAWTRYSKAFLDKHRSTLPAPCEPPSWAVGWVRADTREQVRQIMTPPWW